MKLSALDLPISTSETTGVGVLTEGSRFRAYVVGPCIGRGGMAHIYRAVHEGLQRQVALKVLTERVARDADSRSRFLREARIAASIKHPNVVNIFDVGVHESVPYLVMELLDGEDLDRLLSTKGALDQRTIIDVMIPVVAALAAVHDAGIVHRDLKPGNIFLARGRNNDLEPKVLDFGISKALGPDEFKLTLANAPVLGTPFYLSPEAVHGRDVTALSDQYSLGVVMYECATGVTPFEGQTPAEVLRLIATGTHQPAAERRPELAGALTSIIERAMSLSPDDRFPNMRQLGRELLTLAGQRTRITWALSFASEVESAANARTRPVTPARRGSNAPTTALDAGSRDAWNWTHTALVLVIIALLGALTLASLRRKPPAVVVQSHLAAPSAVVVQSPAPVTAPTVVMTTRDESSPATPTEPAQRPVRTPPARPAPSRRAGTTKAAADTKKARELAARPVAAAPNRTVEPPATVQVSGPNGAPILD